MTKHPDIADLKRNFNYDPETGLITWAMPRGIRVKPGDEAGSLDVHGFVRISLDGKLMLGHYVAWALHHGQWPKGRLKLRSVAHAAKDMKAAARSDLRIDNIKSAENYLSTVPTTVARREYERYQRASRRHKHTTLLAAAHPIYDKNVAWSENRQKWVVTDQRRLPDGSDDSGQRELAEFDKLKDADNFAAVFLANMRALNHAPAGVDPEDRHRTAGLLGAYLEDFAHELVYDPEHGKLIWREGPRMGLSATRKGTGRNDLVQFHGNKYAAHQVAWFLHHHRWPARGTIEPKDGNWRNIKADNWQETGL